MNMHISQSQIDPEFACMMNRLSDDEADQLEANLVREGCRDPLVVWQEEGLLLDGHNRFDICRKHGLSYEVRHVSMPNRQAALMWICENQLGRRNLTPFQKAEAVLKSKPMIAEKAKERQVSGLMQGNKVPVPSTLTKREPIDTRDELAAKAGVSSGTISKAEFIDNHANDKTKEKLRRGDTTINKEYKRLKKEQNAKERQQRKSAPVVIRPDDRCQCITSAIADAHLHVEPESVDFIITDPPYPKEYLQVYSELSTFARHALKEGGSLFCMIGQSYLPELMERLQEHLVYHWTLAYMTPGGQAVQLWNRKVNTFWKPVLWLTKGPYEGDWCGDVITSKTNDNDKEHHHWGQSLSGMNDLMKRFTYPGQTVCDPFLGGGTTGIAALKHNCRFIGLDQDASCVERTQQRIAEECQ